MEIQQHDGMVVEVAGSREGFAKRRERGGALGRGGGLRQNLWCGCPPTPPLFIGGIEGGGPFRTHLGLGAAAKGGGVPPKSSGGPPP